MFCDSGRREDAASYFNHKGYTCDRNKTYVKYYPEPPFKKENYHFEILKNITAVDNKDLGIELIYQLYNIEDEENVLISITTFDNEVESVTSIFDSATADEKEIYDLFGVKFIGNEELKRIYMPESWDGHPLRKDYQENDERLNWND